jgi:hypothetical protein
MLRSEDITTPVPSEVVEPAHQKQATNPGIISYPDAQVRLAMIAQKTLWKLYTERRTARSWSQIHGVMTSLMLELEHWASEALPVYPEPSHTAPHSKFQHMMLKTQHYRMKILITRPALRRIERCSNPNTEDFTAIDQEAAETCIQTAQDVAALFPENLDAKVLYEMGAWWSVIHNSECGIFSQIVVMVVFLRYRSNAIPRYPSNQYILPHTLRTAICCVRCGCNEIDYLAEVFAQEK